MATIPWTEVWRRTYAGSGVSVNGAEYFSKVGLWILCGAPDLILTATTADLKATSPIWTPRVDGGGSGHNNIAVDASRAVIVSDLNWINESLDGITWSGAQTSPATGEALQDVASGVNNSGSPFPYDTFVAVSSASGGPIYDRGFTAGWPLTDTGFANHQLYGVCYAPDLSGLDDWLAVGNNGTFGIIAHTSDPSGIWTRYSISPIAVPYLKSCARGNGLFMVGGAAGSIMTSPTGLALSWTLRATGSTDTIEAIDYLGGSNWLVTGDTGDIRLSSDDGVTWTSVAAVGSDAVNGAVSDSTLKVILLASSLNAWTSFEEEQEDHSPVGTGVPAVTLPENTEYTDQAIRRLIQQFRS